MGAAEGADALRIDVLGPVAAWVDGREVALGGGRPRALLAVLALTPGRVVAGERLIDELWGDDPPTRARDSLQMHVSRLRRALTEAGDDAGRLARRAGGYVLELGAGARDLDRWEAALAHARRARSAGELETARATIEEALAVWRGAPLGGASGHELLEGERARLEEERLAAVIEGIELDLELGRHGELVSRLEALVAAHPLQEHLVALQMLALSRSGRQADALAAFHAARGRLVDELGIEPGVRLRELYEDILRDGPAPARAPREPRLPASPNRTIGRDRDVEAIGERLRAGPVRLLTLTGPGGVGKTRLALEAARAVEAEFADGARLVPLAAVRRPDDVPAAILQALGIVVLDGESARDAVQRFLAVKHLLLVVDNVEHVIAAAPWLGALLEACPGLTVLATSREPLALRAEERHPVAPLAPPDQVALFCERARAHDPAVDLGAASLAAVAEVCRRLDGLPLAIELTAARCALLSPAEIAARLETALRAQGAGARDAPDRQRTLRATIDWSHDLLDDDEQRCFARFAVFARGATVDAAEMITGASLDTLDRLVAKSLLVRRQDGGAPTRLGMLETIRAYAAERFAADPDEHAVRERHCRHHLTLLQRHGTQRALWGPDGGQHLARLDAEADDLHAALDRAVGGADAELALGFAAAIGPYATMRNRYVEALDGVERALSVPGADLHPGLRVGALRTKVDCLWQLGRGAEQRAVLDEMEAIARRLGDPAVLARVLTRRANHEIFAERLDVARAVADEALDLARAADDEWEVAEASHARAITESDLADLRARVDESASLLAAAGNVHRLAALLTDAAYAALCLGGPHDAADFAARATPVAEGTPYARMMNSGNVGLAALLTGETDAARRAFREELALSREMVVRPVVFEGLRGLAAVAVADGDDARAATLVGAAGAHRYDKAHDPVETTLDETFFLPARVRCGPRVWDTALRDGCALSFDDAIAYALDEAAGR